MADENTDKAAAKTKVPAKKKAAPKSKAKAKAEPKTKAKAAPKAKTKAAPKAKAKAAAPAKAVQAAEKAVDAATAAQGTVTIDNVDYNVADLSDDVKYQLQGIQAAEAEIKHLKTQLSLVETARSAYMFALRNSLGKKN